MKKTQVLIITILLIICTPVSGQDCFRLVGNHEKTEGKSRKISCDKKVWLLLANGESMKGKLRDVEGDSILVLMRKEGIASVSLDAVSRISVLRYWRIAIISTELVMLAVPGIFFVSTRDDEWLEFYLMYSPYYIFYEDFPFISPFSEYNMDYYKLVKK